MQTNNKPWIRFRHKVVVFIGYPICALACFLKFGFRADRSGIDKKRQYFILYNHQTPFDQFFVSCAFKKPIYYVATEDIFSIGWPARIIRYLVAPIPIRKGQMDVKALKSCVSIAKEGGTIAIAPEGNRTYSGHTGYINPAIAALAKMLGLPVAIYTIQGGYAAQPRWSAYTRDVSVTGRVTRVIEPEEYKNLGKKEFYELLCKELNWDEHSAGIYKAKKRTRHLAEHLGRSFYMCPECGFTTWHSSGNIAVCASCERRVEYMPDLSIKGEDWDFGYRNAGEWYDAQEAFIRDLDLTQYLGRVIARDENIAVSRVVPYKRKDVILKNTHIEIEGDRLTIGGLNEETIFDNISGMAVCGRNKLNIYIGDNTYQIYGDAEFNAVKYIHIFYHYKYIINNEKGKNDAEFLGL